MTREKYIKIRLTDDEFEKIKKYAQTKDLSVSEVIRDYIKRLPRIPPDASKEESAGILREDW